MENEREEEWKIEVSLEDKEITKSLQNLRFGTLRIKLINLNKEIYLYVKKIKSKFCFLILDI